MDDNEEERMSCVLEVLNLRPRLLENSLQQHNINVSAEGDGAERTKSSA